MNLDQLFEEAGKQYGIDPALLKAQAFAESSLNPNAVGPQTKYGRAEGIAQFIPDTARRLGVTDPKDPKQAIPAQARLMAENIQRYKTPENALMAYHGGTDKSNWGPKTKAYTEKVMASYQPEDDFDPFSYATTPTKPTTTVPRPDAPVEELDFDPFAYAAEEATTQQMEKAQAAGGAPVAGAAKPKPNMWEDVGKTLLSAPIKGLGAIPQIPAMMGNAVGGAIGEAGTFAHDLMADNKLTSQQKQKIIQGFQPFFTGNTPLDTLAQAGGAVGTGEAGSANPLTGEVLYDPQTVPGRMVNAITQGAVAAPAMGAGLASSILGGAGSAGAQEIFPESNVAALVGGAAGGKLGRAVEGTPISAERAQLAKDLQEKYGIKIPSYQLSGSPVVNRLGSMLDRFGMTKDDDVAGAYSRAAAKTMGAEDGAPLTPETMGRTKTTQSKKYEQLFDEIGTIKADELSKGTALQDIIARFSDPETNIYKSENAPKDLLKVTNQIFNSIKETADGDVISAKDFKKLTKHDSLLTKVLKDPDTRQYGIELKNLLGDTLRKSATPEQVARLNKLDAQWKNMRALETAAKTGTAEGEFTPNRLTAAVSKVYDDAAYGGGGELATLAKGGRNFKIAPSSGTAENVGLMHFLGNVLTPMGVGTALQFGGLPSTTALAGAAGTYLAGKGLGRAMTSDAYRKMLINQALNPNSPNMMNLLAPAAITANQ